MVIPNRVGPAGTALNVSVLNHESMNEQLWYGILCVHVDLGEIVRGSDSIF